MCSYTLSLASALDGVGSCLCLFKPANDTRHALYRRPSGPQDCSARVINMQRHKRSTDNDRRGDNVKVGDSRKRGRNKANVL